MNQQRKQIADLILGYLPGSYVSSELSIEPGFGKDTVYRFEISDGDERYGVIITLTKLRKLEAK